VFGCSAKSGGYSGAPPNPLTSHLSTRATIRLHPSADEDPVPPSLPSRLDPLFNHLPPLTFRCTSPKRRHQPQPPTSLARRPLLCALPASSRPPLPSSGTPSLPRERPRAVSSQSTPALWSPRTAPTRPSASATSATAIPCPSSLPWTTEDTPAPSSSSRSSAREPMLL
jgi:hypothetical protein